MAQLRFFFGTMGSGKSTQALQIHHNLRSRGLSVLLMTQLDRQTGRVSSRLGVSAEAVIIDAGVDVFRLLSTEHLQGPSLDAVICDEAQFYRGHQIDQLARFVDTYDVDVYAFGLLTTFQGVLFEGSQRLMELADVRSELQVEARCWCGARATHNARLVNGVQVYDGEIAVVGDTMTDADRADDADAAPVVSYDLRCRRHWLAGREQSHQHELFTEVF